MQKWWAHMADIMATNAKNEPLAVDLQPRLPHGMTHDDTATSPSSISARPMPSWRWSIMATLDGDRGRAAARIRFFPVRPIRITTRTAFGPSSLDGLQATAARITASTPSRSRPMAPRRPCSTANGELAAPVLDYEHDGPDELRADIRCRPSGLSPKPARRACRWASISARSSSGSSTAFPDIRERVANDPDLSAILGLPPDRKGRATRSPRLAATPISGAPGERRFSSLVDKMGWTGLMAPCAAAVQIGLGTSCRMSPRAHGLRPGDAGLLRHPRFQRLALCPSCGREQRRSPSCRPAPGSSPWRSAATTSRSIRRATR